MSGSPVNPGTGLALELDAPGPAIMGLPVLVTIRLTNRGNSSQTVSSRLNLDEGDIRLRITGPNGVERVVSGAGGQPDTPLRRASLAPGQQLLSTVNIFHTSVGDTFTQPGEYAVRAEYMASPRDQWISSPVVVLPVRAAHSDAERSAAAILAPEPVKRALTLAQADEAPDQLRELAERFPGSVAGELARMIAGGSGSQTVTDDILGRADPMTMASWISAVSTPFSRTGKQLAENFAARLSGGGKAAASVRAMRIAKGEPVDPE